MVFSSLPIKSGSNDIGINKSKSMNMKPPQTDGDYQKLLSEVIKKQIIILGPDITLAKARNVAGIEIADDGTVVSLHGDPQLITQKLIEQFTELSGLIVKKTMEPLLANYQTYGTQTNSPAAPSQPNLVLPSQPLSSEQHKLSSDPNQTSSDSKSDPSLNSQIPQSTPGLKPADPVSNPQPNPITPQPLNEQPIPPTESNNATPTSDIPNTPSAPEETNQQTPTEPPTPSADSQASEIPAPQASTNQISSNSQASTEQNPTLSTSPNPQPATDHSNNVSGNHISDLTDIPVPNQAGN